MQVIIRECPKCQSTNSRCKGAVLDRASDGTYRFMPCADKYHD